MDYLSFNKQVLKTFSQAKNRKDFLDQLVMVISDQLDCSCVGIRVFSDSETVHYESYTGFSNDFWHTENELILDQNFCICTRVIRGKYQSYDLPYVTPKKSFYTNDLAEYLQSLNLKQQEHNRGTCFKFGHRSLGVVPLLRDGLSLGAIHLADQRTGVLVPEKINLLEDLAPLFSEAMYRFSLEESLVRSKAGMAKAQQIANVGHWEYDLDKDELHWSDQIFRIFGLSPGEIEPDIDKFIDIIHPADREKVKNAAKKAFSGSSEYMVNYRVICPDGSIREVASQGDVTFDQFGDSVQMIGVAQDVTEKKKAEKKIYFQASLLEQVQNGVIATGLDGAITYWNSYSEKLYGWKADEVIGKKVFEVTVPVDKKISAENILAELNRKGYWHGEFEARRKDNTTFPAEISLSTLQDEQENEIGYVGISADISYRKQMEKQIMYLAAHDPLTNLHNRQTLEDSLVRAAARAKRGDHSVLLIICVDNLNLINEEQGFAAGDKYLIKFANFLKQNLRLADLIVRLEGNEFAALLEGKKVEEVAAPVERLHHAANDHAEVNLGITIGILAIDGNFSADKVLSRASVGIESIKKDGRNRVTLINSEEEPGDSLSEKSRIIRLIKEAIREDNFKLHYQPVVSLNNREVSHYEVLLRLEDFKNGNLIPPDNFIPLAEKVGLMPQVDEWVLNQVLNKLNDDKDMKLFMNVSGASLSEEVLLESFLAKVKQSGIEPGRIGFEITETAAIKDFVFAERWITDLRTLGCQFALDDFGIGFSSFSYLQMLPVDLVKIDGFFVRNIDTDPDQRTMVSAINHVVQAMGKKTVAEFVENERILSILQEYGVDYGQGYLLGKPYPEPGIYPA